MSTPERLSVPYRHAVRSGFLKALLLLLHLGMASRPSTHKRVAENCHQRAKTQDILGGNSESAGSLSGPASSGPSLPCCRCCCPLLHACGLQVAAGTLRRLFPIEAWTRPMPKNSRGAGRRWWSSWRSSSSTRIASSPHDVPELGVQSCCGDTRPSALQRFTSLSVQTGRVRMCLKLALVSAGTQWIATLGLKERK